MNASETKTESKSSKTLLILRHAKSSWKDASLADFDRPLNGRGRKAAEMIGRFIRKERMKPDLVLCSPAMRARETIEIVFKASKLDPKLRFDERIYGAGPVELLKIISLIEAGIGTVLLVGHNPGMEQLLQLLTGYVERIPTATLAKINCGTGDWSLIAEAKGSLELLVKPKELSS